MRPKHHVRKSDVYAMGMVLLEAATLKPVSELYDSRRFEVTPQKLDQRIAFVSANYSEEFGQFLREILAEREENRPDFLTLASRLSANQSPLKNRLSPKRTNMAPVEQAQAQAQNVQIQQFQPYQQMQGQVHNQQYQMGVAPAQV